MWIHARYILLSDFRTRTVGERKRNKPMLSLSLSHLLGILHSTSQRQHLRASIHHGFNYKEQGSSDSLIHV